MSPEVCLVRRFLVPAVPPSGEMVALDEATSHHLLRVTGIAPDESVEIFDGQGEAAQAALVRVADGAAVLRVVRRWSDVQPSVSTHVLLGQTRAQVLDGTLRMVTELGVASIQVVHMARCVAKGDKRVRWRRIVESAAAQCGRTVLPDILPPLTFAEVLNGRDGACLVLVHCFNAGLPASEGTTRKLMDYVRVELQREGKHKPFVYLSIMALLQGLLRAHERRLAFIDAKGLDMLLTLIRDGKNQSNTQVSDSSVCGMHTYLHS